MDEESYEDEADEVSYDPYGLCSKDRGEDECVSESDSHFCESDFEPECSSEPELVHIEKETKEDLNDFSRNEDIDDSNTKLDLELMNNDKVDDLIEEPMIKITPNEDIENEKCLKETTMELLTQLEFQNQQAASIRNITDKKRKA